MNPTGLIQPRQPPVRLAAPSERAVDVSLRMTPLAGPPRGPANSQHLHDEHLQEGARAGFDLPG
eukprot:9496563-Pyramimonas_sp.AAC.1